MLDLLENKIIEGIPSDQPNSMIRLVDCMPRCVPGDIATGDFAIVQAARVSYGIGTKKLNEDRGLIRYLLRHQHTTPFEMLEFKWHMKMPIFIARQWIRHRTANVNEYSARYSEVSDVFYIPSTENTRKQSKRNKQGGDDKAEISEADLFREDLENMNRETYNKYKHYVDLGMAREQARMLLQCNVYTEWYWKNDLWNTMNFLRLRMDEHAQQEIRVLANIMYDIMKPIVPIAMEAFDDYINYRHTIKLTRLEVQRIASRTNIQFDNKREEEEFQIKVKKLGLVLE